MVRETARRAFVTARDYGFANKLAVSVITIMLTCFLSMASAVMWKVWHMDRELGETGTLLSTINERDKQISNQIAAMRAEIHALNAEATAHELDREQHPSPR